VLLVVVFAGGALVMTVGIGKLTATVMTSSYAELRPMYGADVPPAKRAQLDAIFDGISRDLATDKLAFSKLEPLLNTMRDAMADKKVTNAEADQLLAKVQEMRKPAGKPSSVIRHPASKRPPDHG
jgi:hypothetical protein